MVSTKRRIQVLENKRKLTVGERFNLSKMKRLSKQGFEVGEVGFKSRENALRKLAKSNITEKRKKRLSVRKFKAFKTGKPAFVFVEKKKR